METFTLKSTKHFWEKLQELQINEKNTMFVGGKTQYCLHNTYEHCDLTIQYNPSQNSSRIFGRVWEVNPKIHVIFQRTHNSQTTLIKKKVGKLMLPNFNTCYKATVIEIVWYWCQDQQIKATVEDLKIDPHIHY